MFLFIEFSIYAAFLGISEPSSLLSAGKHLLNNLMSQKGKAFSSCPVYWIGPAVLTTFTRLLSFFHSDLYACMLVLPLAFKPNCVRMAIPAVQVYR